jgi:hypothetical protein
MVAANKEATEPMVPVDKLKSTLHRKLKIEQKKKNEMHIKDRS